MKRGNETLRNLLRLNRTTLELMSSKPFKPSSLDVIVSMDAPQLYNEEELVQIKKLYNLQKMYFSNDIMKERINCKTEVKKHCSPTEDMQENGIVEQVNKKARKIIIISKNARKMSEDENSRNMISLSKNVASSSSSSPPPPELPDIFKNRIKELNGTDIKLLIQKTLYKTDVTENNNRLSLPLSKILCDFLSEDEKRKIDAKEGTRRQHGIDVTLIDPCLREFNTLTLKKWDMNKTIIYNLTTDWNMIVRENELKVGQEVQVWSFRVNIYLYFILVKL